MVDVIDFPSCKNIFFFLHAVIGEAALCLGGALVKLHPRLKQGFLSLSGLQANFSFLKSPKDPINGKKNMTKQQTKQILKRQDRISPYLTLSLS